jgi:hypothetical protein
LRLLRAGLLLSIALLAGCGSPPPALDATRSLDAPAVYRVSTTAESSFSGPVSDLAGATELTAAFRTTPISGSEVEVEVLYLAASVENADGEPVALSLEPLAGREAVVEMGPPGVVSGIRGGEELLEAPIPLISMREVIWSLFPPLPDGTVRRGDTWAGDAPIPFSILGGPPQRMRYAVSGIDSSGRAGAVEGYELRVGPRSFEAKTASGAVSGEGDLEIDFGGELVAREGYLRTKRTDEFDSDFIRLGDASRYANGTLHLRRTTIIERLSSVEQFGLDP